MPFCRSMYSETEFPDMMHGLWFSNLAMHCTSDWLYICLTENENTFQLINIASFVFLIIHVSCKLSVVTTTVACFVLCTNIIHKLKTSHWHTILLNTYCQIIIVRIRLPILHHLKENLYFVILYDSAWFSVKYKFDLKSSFKGQQRRCPLHATCVYMWLCCEGKDKNIRFFNCQALQNDKLLTVQTKKPCIYLFKVRFQV